jgi:iron complex outermembrane receptor protein
MKSDLRPLSHLSISNLLSTRNAPLYRAAILSISLACGGEALAQTNAPPAAPGARSDAENPTELPPTVVTASPLERTTFEAAAPVTVLSGEELNYKMAPTLGETLANEPGVNSTYYGPNASRPVIRGLDGDHIRLLQNGVGLIDASATSVDHAVSTDPLTLKKIEVVRGPAALMYGSTAVGGVVNLLNNRIPDSIISDPVTGVVEGRYGSVDNLRSGSGLAEGGYKGFNYHLDGFVRETDDLSIPGFARSARLRAADPLPPGETEAKDTLPNSQSKSDGGALGGSYVWDKGYVGASVSGFNDNYGTVAEEDVTIRMYERRVDFAGEFSEPFEKVHAIRYKFGLSDYKHTEYEGEETGTIFKSKGYDARLEVVHHKLGILEGAIGYQSTKFDFSALGDEAFLPKTDTFVNSLFLFEEIVFDPLRLQFGGRVDYQTVDASADRLFGPADSRTFVTGSGSVGIVYTPVTNYAIALSASYTQRAPNYQELYANGPHLATAAFEVGNRDLDVENSVGIDLSLRKQGGPITGSIGGFYNWFDHYITLIPTGVNDTNFDVQIFDYVGVPAEFYGTEGQVTFHLLDTEKHKVHLELQADYLHARNRETGEPLPRISPLRFGGNVVYEGKHFGARFEVMRYQKQDDVAANELPTDGYTMINVGADYRFEVGRLGFDIFAKGTNLLDEEARNHVSFLKDIAPMGGIGAVAGLRVVF